MLTKLILLLASLSVSGVLMYSYFTHSVISEFEYVEGNLSYRDEPKGNNAFNIKIQGDSTVYRVGKDVRNSCFKDKQFCKNCNIGNELRLYLYPDEAKTYPFSDDQVRFVVGVYANGVSYSSIGDYIDYQESQKPATLFLLVMVLIISFLIGATFFIRTSEVEQGES